MTNITNYILDYKLAHVVKKNIKIAARKALIASDSLYYSYTAEQQQKHRVCMDEKACLRVQQVLLDSVLGIKCQLKEVEEVWDEIPIDNLN